MFIRNHPHVDKYSSKYYLALLQLLLYEADTHQNSISHAAAVRPLSETVLLLYLSYIAISVEMIFESEF